MRPPDFVSFDPERIRFHDASAQTVQCVFRGSTAPTDEAVSVWYNQTEHFLPVPPAAVLYAVIQALEGNASQAYDSIIEDYGSNSSTRAAINGFRRKCQQVLSPEIYIEVVGALVSESRAFDYAEYRGRYDYFVNLIDPLESRRVDSLDRLIQLVDTYNQTVDIKAVSVAEVLSQYLAENPSAEARDHIRYLGCDARNYDPDYTTPFPAAWLAQVYLTGGLRDAEHFAMDRPRSSGQLERNITVAKQADNQDKPTKWGLTIADAARDSLDQFQYVAYKTLYHNGRQTPIDAAYHPMLFRAAKSLARELGVVEFEQRGAFEEQNALGHVNRHAKDYEAARGAFDRALEIASGETGNGFSPDLFRQFLAMTGRAAAESELQLERDNVDGAITGLENAITELQSMHIGTEVLREREISLLRGKLFENRGHLALREGDQDAAYEAFEQSVKEYDRGEKYRSRDIVEEKLRSIET